MTNQQIGDFATLAFAAKCTASGQKCRFRGRDIPCLAGPGDTSSLLEPGGFHEDASRTIYVSAAIDVTLNETIHIDDKPYHVTAIGSTGPAEKKLTLRESR